MRFELGTRWLGPTALFLMAGFGQLACQSGDEIQLVLVTTSAMDPQPEQTIDVSLVVANQTELPLSVVSAELTLEPPDPSFRFVVDPTSPAELAPQSQTNVRLQATLPLAWEELTIDGEVLAAHRDDDHLYRTGGAETPLRIVSTESRSVETDLIVSSLEDELDGTASVAGAGGQGDLSLREAVAIANRRPGPDTILFSPQQFAGEQPGTIVWDESLESIVVSDAGTTIDATNRGVIIQGNERSGPPFLVQAPQFSVVNVSMRGFRYYALHLEGAGNATVRRCSVQVDDPWSGRAAVHIVASPGLRFVGNSLSGGDHMMRVIDSHDVVIADNEFDGADDTLILDGCTDVRVSDNLMYSHWHAIRLYNSHRVRIERNIVNHSGYSCILLSYGSSDNAIVANQLDGCADHHSSYAGIYVEEYSHDNRFSRNLITDSNGRLIYIEPGSNRDVSPPQIDSATPQLVSGTSPVGEGLIELFADSGDQAGVFAGTATAAGDGSWSVEPTAELEAGMSVRATVTNAGGNTSILSDPVTLP